VNAILSPMQFAQYLERTQFSIPVKIEVHRGQVFDRIQSARSGRTWLRPHKPVKT
jgi:hypothetical protein